MNQKQIAGIVFLFYFLLTYLCKENIFFGDMVQFGSRHPHFFLETNFSEYFLPNNLDSGHPPIFGIYIAFLWKIFGKSLEVSHFAMLPFLGIISYQIPKLLSRWVAQKELWIATILIIFEPTFFSQTTLVSPDIVLIAFFLLSINAYLDKKFLLLSIVLIPLGLISLRGMIVLFASFVSVIIFFLGKKERVLSINFLRIIVTFFPSAFLSSIWLLLHYVHAGWIGFHSDSPWASSFQQVNSFQIIKNAGLFIWRLADFGRVTVWIIALILIWVAILKKQVIPIQKNLLKALLIFATIFAINTLFADGLVGHRYYMPIYFIVLLFVLVNIQSINFRWKVFAYNSIFISFLIGSFYIYPPKIAMGWDATPAHLSYYSLRKNAINYLNKNNIPLYEVACGFPNLDSREILELNGDSSSFSSYAISNRKYILWSNVFNYPDDLIDSLSSKVPIYEKNNLGVFMKIYKK